MNLQVNFESERLAAYEAWMSKHLIMGLAVDIQLLHVVERFTANVTLVRLFTAESMSSRVISEAVEPCKGSVALLTLVALLAGVLGRVLGQLVVILKRFVAPIAFVRSDVVSPP